MTKPRFRQINTADVPDAAIDRINESLQVPKLVRPSPNTGETARQHHVEPSRQRTVEPSGLPGPVADRHKLTVRVPRSLNDMMKHDALDHRTHVNIIICTALLAAGYHLPPSDVLPPDAASRLRFAILSRRSSVEPSDRQTAGASVQQKLTISAPASLDERMKRDALSGQSSVRCIVLLALQAFGYPIAEADLAPGAGGNC